jgi:hypothetical protein
MAALILRNLKAIDDDEIVNYRKFLASSGYTLNGGKAVF